MQNDARPAMRGFGDQWGSGYNGLARLHGAWKEKADLPLELPHAEQVVVPDCGHPLQEEILGAIVGAGSSSVARLP